MARQWWELISCDIFQNSFDASHVRWVLIMNHPCLVMSFQSIIQFIVYVCQALTAALACIHPLHGEWTPEDNYWFNQR